MRVRLLHPDHESDPHPTPDASRDALAEDLGLDALVKAMAAGDDVLAQIATVELGRPERDPAIVGYRLAVLADALAHPAAFQRLYELAEAALQAPKKAWMWSGRRPYSVLARGTETLAALVPALTELRQFAAQWHTTFTSPGMRAMLETILADLDDTFFAEVADHLKQLQYRSSMVMTASVGADGKPAALTLRRTRPTRKTWRDLLGLASSDELTFLIAERDEASARALSEVTDAAIIGVAEALGRSAEHVLGFYAAVRWDVGFLLGCLNLDGALRRLGHRTCLPVPRPTGAGVLHAHGLFDPGLALRSGARTVPNDLDADSVRLVFVTGANQGGKSTFLRAVGLAQTMMQCGMTVPAADFEASVCGRVHTHFKQAEDERMERGKLDEELARMSVIVDLAAPGDLLLSNESFASTNEREGSEIGRQVIEGLAAGGVRVISVTHLYELAQAFRATPHTLYLTPERTSEGARTYLIREGYPDRTSHALDLYERVFLGAGATGATSATSTTS